MNNVKLIALSVVLSTLIVLIGVYTGFLSFVNRFPFALELISNLWDTLGSSLIFFSIDFVFFIFVLITQKEALEKKDMLNISFYGTMVTLSISIFFAIGVIYTAIGMQNALISALGGLGKEMVASIGAWEILSKLVNGGIVTALSTTIVGGVGGYMMKVSRQIYIGKALEKYLIKTEEAEKRLVYRKLDEISLKLDQRT